ncbi:c-type cytochrome [Pseudomonas sp. YH-1]|uniref:c-type cytochrome n=1 Tax=Pseudomonas sp. YH-1 TaxID=3384787 RepID=UPI003F7E5B0D
MKNSLTSATTALLAALLCMSAQASDMESELVARGRYISLLGNCQACHTTAGEKPYAGGVKLQSPFGTLVGSNITPDPETGLGQWAFDDFKRAMSEGKGRNGLLYPAMPYPYYHRVTDEDNTALWAYLKSIEPVRHPVQSNLLPFPYNQRYLMLGWNLLNFSSKPFEADPGRSPEWNRGAYIVEGLGHCGGCHTPKNLIGGDETSRALSGYVVDSWYATDITANGYTGIGDWSVADITEYLRTGRNRFDTASGPMAEVVNDSSQHWTEADAKAVAVYLKESASSTAKAPRPLGDEDPRLARGADVYAFFCTGCHGATGRGVARLFPPLADTALVRGESPASLLRIVLGGSRQGVDTALGAPGMPAFARHLDDRQIADVLTFLRNHWGNAATPVSTEAVRTMRQQLKAGAK